MGEVPLFFYVYVYVYVYAHKHRKIETFVLL